MVEEKGLVGKLKDVEIGDIISLYIYSYENRSRDRRYHLKEINVVGYVFRLTATKIKITMEDPFKHNFRVRSLFHPFNPVREYLLSCFDEYKILEKHNSQKK